MHRILVLGAGKIGTLISGLLADSGDYQIHLADIDGEAARSVAVAHGLDKVTAFELDATDPVQLAGQIDDNPVDAVVSGLPYFCNESVGQVAKDKGIHYFDLTEDVSVTKAIRKIAQGADRAFVPQCGLAPGFISIAANELIRHFDELRSVKLRVGALPQHPNNALKYSLTWSTDGVINEYGNMCHAVVNGELVDVLPLEGLEEIELDGTLYEAFNTSGGLGSLAETYAGQATTMDYKTIRYPGHCAQMRLLMNDLKLNENRGMLKQILENSVPHTLQDVVIIYTAVSGMQDGRLCEENYVNKVYPAMIAGRLWSAIQVTTAAGICSVLDLVVSNAGHYKGLVRQEDFRLKDILDNRFGKYFAQGGSSAASMRAIATGATGHDNGLSGDAS
ncbi:MAG: saccharopine dehydrogenase NADP-binding domain-containing protein [Gammaproteobacteria bacterium]|nr:saccharopine dehydrogenase NADP-binding domain-containing protein [Gammaproteobacteria bacterium]